MLDLKDPHARMAHARSFRGQWRGRTHTGKTCLQMSRSTRIRRETDVAKFFDAVCANHHMTLADIARKTDASAGFISKLRSGDRLPGRQWLTAFVENCGLDADEIAVAGDLFNPVPDIGRRRTPINRLNPVAVLRPEDV